MSFNHHETLPYRKCVGIMVVNKDKKVFVGQRIDHSSTAWQMPQGGVDEGESESDASLRELSEETGITEEKVSLIAVGKSWVSYDLPPEMIPKLWGGQYRGQKQKWFLYRFNGLDVDINIRKTHQEFSNWCWMEIDQLLDNIVPFKRQVYTKVIREFQNNL
jgi:putative (di)nucleoside polyphosphate hydrolase